jgi:uncharacterized Zn finger protein (UPF0148 family)
MSLGALEFTCEACGSQGTVWEEEFDSDGTVGCPSCGSFSDVSRFMPHAVRTAIERILDTRWPGAYLGIDTEDWVTDTHAFTIRSAERQYRITVGKDVRQSGDIRGAVNAIRRSGRIWIQLLKDGGSVHLSMR